MHSTYIIEGLGHPYDEGLLAPARMRVHRLFSSVSSLAAVSRNPAAVKVGPLLFQ